MNPYDKVLELSKQAAIFGSIRELLDWDQETYMPSAATEIRAEQNAHISQLIHKAKTSKSFIHALEKLIDIESGEIIDSSLPSEKIASLRAWRADLLKNIKLPTPFVKRFASLTSQASNVWAQARSEDRFELFAPFLNKIVIACRKKASYLGFKDHPYDALLDIFEPKMTVAKIEPVFAQLKLALTALLKEIASKPGIDTAIMQQEFSHEDQMHMGHKLLNFLGIEKQKARLDLSRHPFCVGIHPTDTRMATRILPNNFLSNILSVLHEGGHALYHMGLPAKHFGTPLAEPLSYGIDESQSRWWETFVGRSFAFWQHFFPTLQKHCPKQLEGIYLDDFYLAVNAVKPSLIRVEADEVTYCLHIILRFEIEKQLIEGSLSVKDVPRVWKEKMKGYLGIMPLSNKDGCLQDIHWSIGAFGYFPSYALGNIYAGQFFAAFEHKHPSWKTDIASGNTATMRSWLHSHIHTWGRQFSALELLEKLGCKDLDPAPYINHLTTKYRALYHITSSSTC